MLAFSTRNISTIAAAFMATTVLGANIGHADHPAHNHTVTSQAANHDAVQAIAAAIAKRTYATAETEQNLGTKIFGKLHEWAGNKPVFVLRLEDFGDDGSTLETVRQKLIEIGMPLKLLPDNEVLQRLSDRINKNRDKNYYAAAFPLGAYGIMIGISDTAELRTKETIALATGFPIDAIENFPDSATGHKEIIYKHEAGHIKKHVPVETAADVTRSEIIADQIAVDIDGVEFPTKESLEGSFSAYHLLMAKTLGLLHVPGQNMTANTIPNVYMPWETRPPELEGVLFFENNSLQNLRPLRIKCVEGNTDRELWRKGLQQVFTSATGIKHIPEEERHTMAFIAEYIVPQSVIDIVWEGGKFQKRKILDQFDSTSLEGFAALYQDHPEFLEAIKERMAFTTLKEKKDTAIVEACVIGAHKRLAEITGVTIEKRFLEKYLEAAEYYFPETFDKAKQLVHSRAEGQQIPSTPTP